MTTGISKFTCFPTYAMRMHRLQTFIIRLSYQQTEQVVFLSNYVIDTVSLLTVLLYQSQLIALSMHSNRSISITIEVLWMWFLFCFKTWHKPAESLLLHWVVQYEVVSNFVAAVFLWIAQRNPSIGAICQWLLAVSISKYHIRRGTIWLNNNHPWNFIVILITTTFF